jgi:hypothetical protein
MYVEDVTDVQELLQLRGDLVAECCEQCKWDIEDIDNRLYELGGK